MTSSLAPVVATATRHSPLFTISHLSKTFPNGYRALKDITLDIYSGECLVVTGANGSGKTILMKIIAALTDPSSGEILFKGKPTAKSRAEIRRSVGIVFQDADAQIIGTTVEEDIRFGPQNLKLEKTEIDRRAGDALLAMGLADKRDVPPRHLSGGEKRRLAVAGVLAMGAEAVIMDEPFANLDWPGVLHVRAVIGELLSAGKTVVVLTHELEKVLDFAGRLVVLCAGEIKADGKPLEVLDALETEWGVKDPREGY
jgi:biotin transport system ATP-binding protein